MNLLSLVKSFSNGTSGSVDVSDTAKIVHVLAEGWNDVLVDE